MSESEPETIPLSQPAGPWTIGVPCETFPGERRVALVPGNVGLLKKSGLEVVVERGAGVHAGFPDAMYSDAGATVLPNRGNVLTQSQVILQVRTAGANAGHFDADLEAMRKGQVLIGLCDPLTRPELVSRIAERGVLAFSLELLPRITRAQSMDVLSSQANIAGYKAVLMAAAQAPRLFPMLMTAAGTLTPAKVFVIGAGVAGLQAIATARRLGANVKAYDVRAAVKEEVQSLGAKFVEVPLSADATGTGGYAKAMDEAFYQRQREALTPVIAESHVVITTASVPGRRAPVLVTRHMVEQMMPGTVIVDLAAEQGGNCELTQPGESLTNNGVTILGCVNLPATVPFHASQTYSKNIVTFVQSLFPKGQWTLDLADEVIAATLLTHDGSVVNPRVKEALNSKDQPRP